MHFATNSICLDRLVNAGAMHAKCVCSLLLAFICFGGFHTAHGAHPRLVSLLHVKRIRALLSCLPAMLCRQWIIAVFFLGTPTQIACAIVQGIAVDVINAILAIGLIVESGANQARHIKATGEVVLPQLDNQPPSARVVLKRHHAVPAHMLARH